MWMWILVGEGKYENQEINRHKLGKDNTCHIMIYRCPKPYHDNNSYFIYIAHPQCASDIFHMWPLIFIHRMSRLADGVLMVNVHKLGRTLPGEEFNLTTRIVSKLCSLLKQISSVSFHRLV